MLRPEKTWAVGDKTFPTYDEARAYIASRRGELQRENLIAVLTDAIDYGEGSNSETPPSAIADAILAKFKITPRKS